MKKKNILINLLHGFFKISFWMIILLLIINLSFEFFTKDGKLGSFSTGNHHSKGYSIPVRIKTHVRNPIFNNWNLVNKREFLNQNGRKMVSGNLEYFNEMPENINNGTHNIIRFHYRNDIEYFTTTESSFIHPGYMIAKSDMFSIKALLILRTYLLFFFLIFAFLFLKNIFSLLKKNFSFSPKLFNNVRWLGFALIIKIIIAFIISYIISDLYGLIDTETLVDGETFSSTIRLIINPRLEFDLTLFLCGISFLVLASLLKSGSAIQQENDLTI